MAEAVFDHLVRQANLQDQIAADSAGTSDYHEGEAAHSGTLKVLRQHGIAYAGRSRPLEPRDFERFDYLIAMDQSHLDAMQIYQQAMQNPNVKIARLLDYAPHQNRRDVPDPYYTGQFDSVYELVEWGARGLLEQIRKDKHLP